MNSFRNGVAPLAGLQGFSPQDSVQPPKKRDETVAVYSGYLGVESGR